MKIQIPIFSHTLKLRSAFSAHNEFMLYIAILNVFLTIGEALFLTLTDLVMDEKSRKWNRK
jgi:hypothetical protein